MSVFSDTRQQDYGSLNQLPPSDVSSGLPILSSAISHASARDNEGLVSADETFTAAGEATIISEVFNISKNLIGGGVLSLSGGIAMYSDSPDAVFSAIMWVMLLGATFAYFCLIIGKACDMTQSFTYRECWERTVGKKGNDFVSAINILDPLLGVYANATILSQSLHLLLQGIDVDWSTQICLLVITLFGIIPLCMMKNLNALAPFSAIGMVSVLCALAAMTVRLVDGSYDEGGKYFDEILAKPQFGSSNKPWSISALPFVCMVYTSFDMHYNSPTYYAELKDASIPRFRTTVFWSFAVTSILYFAIGVVGFLTFGASCESYILNNYSPKDPLATVARLAIGLCSLFSYPLNYIGVRDNVIELYQLQRFVQTRERLNGFSLIFLIILTITELFVTDLGLINSVGGGTTVTLICFVFPAMMFRDGVYKLGKESDHKEVNFVLILTVIGVVLGLVGVYNAIATA